jgi:CRISP-associated protein Cas1
MLKGRLGLETARVPQGDRHGLLWLGRGRLHAEDGTLHFVTAGHGDLAAGDYGIPFQLLTALLLSPGTTVSHDAIRLLARHGTGLLFVGEDGVRMYGSMPFGPDESARARAQVRLWSDLEQRRSVARRMYAWRLGEVVPSADIAVLRGIEGARMKEMYRLLADKHGVEWSGRRYDRADPESATPPNQALNHVVTAVEACAMVAVSVTGVLPQLGFIHEDSGNAFTLDITDLFRDTVTVPIAFEAVKAHRRTPREPLERIARQMAGRAIRGQALVNQMIDRIKELFDGDDGRSHPERG